MKLLFQNEKALYINYAIDSPKLMVATNHGLQKHHINMGLLFSIIYKRIYY